MADGEDSPQRTPRRGEGVNHGSHEKHRSRVEKRRLELLLFSLFFLVSLFVFFPCIPCVPWFSSSAFFSGGTMIRVGNGCGFWGDNLDAPVRLCESGRLDFLTLEYLAELTMSILAVQRSAFRTILRKFSLPQFLWKCAPVKPKPRPPSGRSTAHARTSSRPLAATTCG